MPRIRALHAGDARELLEPVTGGQDAGVGRLVRVAVGGAAQGEPGARVLLGVLLGVVAQLVPVDLAPHAPGGDVRGPVVRPRVVRSLVRGRRGRGGAQREVGAGDQGAEGSGTEYLRRQGRW